MGLNLYWVFPVSGVKTWFFLPPLVAFVVSFFTSMGGVSGAFILLPFQVSVLGYSSPSVSATNFVYNIVAIPSGVYRFIKEGRMAWPLTWVVIAGTLPGVFLGYLLRIRYLPDPRSFKFFVGCVLLYLGVRLLYEMTPSSQKGNLRNKALEEKFNRMRQEMAGQGEAGLRSGLPSEGRVRTLRISLSRVEYVFWGEKFSFSTPAMFLLASVVGVIGGTYGIGGGAIIAPFCVTVFRLPVYTVAGAALLGTFITSVVGVFYYSVLPAQTDMVTSPDWLLGFLFGAGGFAGMYLGARAQKWMPQTWIKGILGVIITFLALSYIVQYFK